MLFCCFNIYNIVSYVTEIELCKPNPCLHGGACEPKDDAYACACKEGFTGIICETSSFCL